MSFPANSLLSTIDTMKSENRNDYWNNSASWRQYIYDHRQEILDNAIIHTVDPHESHANVYSMESYIRMVFGAKAPTSMAWIVLWLNQLDSVMNFSELDVLYIPSLEHLNLLRRQYINTITMQKKNLGHIDL